MSPLEISLLLATLAGATIPIGAIIAQVERIQPRWARGRVSTHHDCLWRRRTPRSGIAGARSRGHTPTYLALDLPLIRRWRVGFLPARPRDPTTRGYCR